MSIFSDKGFRTFTIKFLLIFSICYFGTLILIGAVAPGGFYSPFAEKYLDYVGFIMGSLIEGSKFLLSFFGFHTYRAPFFVIRVVNDSGVQIAYDCVGYGVMSFWIAFVLASVTNFKKKIVWLISGLLLIWIINVCRISLVLVANYRHWRSPIGLDHHTLFNIVAYIAIFIMMYFFSKNSVKGSVKKI
ncbi:MAG: exosortase/archaeosortase family protein [Ferruginibacter sp.]